MQTHFAGKVRKSDLAFFELHSKERVWKRLFDDSFYDLRFSHICAAYNSNSF